MSQTNRKRAGRKPNPESKRSQGTDRHTKPRKSFHAEQELFDALGKLIEESQPKLTESACLRTALEEFLRSRGYWTQTQKS